ncbi:MAG: DUF2336 domain-containing protein [Variibacter sp.]|nr:DUF2336 domain-containing protein [Variibacter sp.]
MTKFVSGHPPPARPVALDLVALAAEKSPERRLELLHRITDTFLSHTVESATSERYLLNEIVDSIVAKLGGEHLAQASQCLAQLSDLPDDVVEKLAGDADIAVAGPMLRGYSGLKEQALVRIANTASADQLEAIAGRRVVTPPVSDVVVTRGDSRVVRTLAANAGAQFSSQGMDTLINRAANDADLQSLIVERADLTPAAISRLLPLISDELANRLRFVDGDMERGDMRLHLTQWMADRKANIARVDAYIASVKKGDLNLPNVCMELIRNKRLLDAAYVLASVINIDRHYTFNVLTQGRVDNVLMLLRAVELPWRVADAFLSLRRSKFGPRAGEPLISQLYFDAIDVAGAQRVLRFLKVRQAAQTASEDRESA